MSHPNALINETSPYLLQHAHNPVNWLAWNASALKKAVDNDRLMLVSIGYSACHWCHVMEKECFEQQDVAAVMNDNFVCIKVDREERPDVDQMFMDAVQLMTQRGGWPLNVVVLPDGRPIWGATYLPKKQWVDALNQINTLFQNRRGDVMAYADRLISGLQQLNFLPESTIETPFNRPELDALFYKLEQQFDVMDGGLNHVPKFPMPGIYSYLLRYWRQSKEKNALEQVSLTLSKMAHGGIYDQLGGGFSRYSVDGLWKVPHFEKMLYDNALLVNLYAEAFAATENPLFENVVSQTIDFVQRELGNGNGAFCCALDADSEGVEGKYYVWTKDEFLHVLREDKFLLYSYWQIDDMALWEDGNNILMPVDDVDEFCQKHDIGMDILTEKVGAAKKALFQKRQERVRPGLDNKVLTSWNAQMIKALLTAYRYLNKEDYLQQALLCHKYLKENMISDGNLKHDNRPLKSGLGFLEDYAFYIDALIEFFEVSGDFEYLQDAQNLLAKTEALFADNNSELFFLSPATNREILIRRIDYQDNVIPSGNSVMAHNYFKLGKILENHELIKKAEKMLKAVLAPLKKDPAFYYNWASLYNCFVGHFHQIVIIGSQAPMLHKELLHSGFIPNKVLISSTIENELTLTKGRYMEGKTLIYNCINGQCQLPVETLPQLFQNLSDR